MGRGWRGRRSLSIHEMALVGKLNIKFNFSSLAEVSPALQSRKYGCKTRVRLKEGSDLLSSQNVALDRMED